MKTKQISIAVYDPNAVIRTNTLSELQKVWKQTMENIFLYEDNVFTCDDFSIIFKSEMVKYYAPTEQRSCGIVWALNPDDDTDGHAYNFFIDEFWNIVYFEPQTGRPEDITIYTKIFFVIGY